MIFLALLSLSLDPARAASLAGTVTGPDGQPLAYATIYAYDLRLSSVNASADAAGSWRIDDLPAGRYRLLALPHYTGAELGRFYPGSETFCGAELLTVAETDALEDLDFALPGGGVLRGQVLDPAGDPVAGAVVTAVPVEGEVDEGVFPRANLTDADGRFAVGGLAAADWRCEIDADGLPDQLLGPAYEEEEAAIFPADPGTDEDLGAFSLLGGIVVRGAVYGPDEPAAGAEVIVYAGGQVRTVLTDESGAYEASGLPPGDVLPWTEPEGLALTYYPDVDRPTTFLSAPSEGDALEGADLFPPPEATLAVTLVDSGSGEPILGASVLLYNSSHTVGKGAGADDAGVALIRGLHGGTYELYVYAGEEGYLDGWLAGEDGLATPIVVDGGAANTLEIPLERRARIGGVVRDEDGQPVYGALVQATPADGSDAVSARADETGAYTLEGLAAGEWQISATYVHYCEEDPGWVAAYWPGEVNPDWQQPLDVAAGGDRADVDLTLPRDDDHDAMGDAWEREVGLDPGRDDGGEDPDEDGYLNRDEYLLGTDPFDFDAAPGSGGCCRGDGEKSALLLPLLLIPWRRRRRP